MYQLVPKKKKYIVLKIIGVLFACAFIKEILVVLFAAPPVSEQLDSMVSKMNERCPMVIDSMTTLANFGALNGNTLIVNYRLNTAKAAIDAAEAEAANKEYIINQIKTNPSLAFIKTNKLSLFATYYDSVGVFVLNISITPKDINGM